MPANLVVLDKIQEGHEMVVCVCVCPVAMRRASVTFCDAPMHYVLLCIVQATASTRSGTVHFPMWG